VTDAVADAARSAAVILAPELGPNLPTEVEAALFAREHGDQRPGQYDPAAIASLGISAAGLIVSIAQLAQAILSDRRNHGAGSSPDSIARQVRISLREFDVSVPSGTDHVTDVVVTEIIRLSGDHGQPDPGNPHARPGDPSAHQGRLAPVHRLCLSLCLIHLRPPPFTGGRPGCVRAGHGRWRTQVNAGQHCWKACWGQPSRVRISHPPPR